MKYILAAAILLISMHLCSAQVNPAWKQVGSMEGGEIFWLDVQDGNILAGTYLGGLFISSDEGDTWTLVPGTRDAIVTSARVKGDTIIAGLVTKGIGVSVDGGQTWKMKTYEQLGINVSGCYLIGEAIVAKVGSTTYVSTDLGDHWFEVEELDGRPAFVLGRNIITYHSNEMWYSDDLSLTWKQCQGVGVTGAGITFGHITTVGGTTYLVESGNRNILSTTDDGKSWRIHKTYSDTINNTILYHPTHTFSYSSQGHCYASYDGMKTFELEVGNLPQRYPYRTACMSENYNFLSSPQGVYRKWVHSSEWHLANVGLTCVQVLNTLVYKGSLFAVTNQGMYASSNEGADWTHVDPFQFWDQFKCLWIWDDVLHVSKSTAELYTTDGVVWRTPETTEMRGFDNAVVLNNLMLGARYGSLYYTVPDTTLKRVTDPSGTLVNPIAVNASMFAAGFGERWYIGTDITQPKNVIRGPIVGSSADYVLGLAIDNENTVYVAGPRKVQCTKPPYKTFIDLIPNTGSRDRFYSLHGIDLGALGWYLIASKDSALLLSRDKGNTWTDISAGGPLEQINSINHLGDKIYVCTNGNGLWELDLEYIVGVTDDEVRVKDHTCDASHSRTYDVLGRVIDSSLGSKYPTFHVCTACGRTESDVVLPNSRNAIPRLKP